jgi:hypothetical protein
MKKLTAQELAKKDFDKVSHYTYFDPMVHSTIEDMTFVSLHELDLHAEGEYWHPIKVRRDLLNFITKHGSDNHKNEALRQFNNGKDKRKEDSYI